jgi:hypothetical protein
MDMRLMRLPLRKEMHQIMNNNYQIASDIEKVEFDIGKFQVDIVIPVLVALHTPFAENADVVKRIMQAF